MDSPFKAAMEIGACVLLLGFFVHAYIKIRGEKFGPRDMIVFGAFALAVDLILYKFLGGYQPWVPSPDGYANLGSLMLFLLLTPIASFCNSVFIAAIFWNLSRNRALVAGLAVLTMALCSSFFLARLFSDAPPKKSPPAAGQEAPQTLSGIDGEDWSFANDPNAAQCRKKAPNQAFLDGCMKHAQVEK